MINIDELIRKEMKEGDKKKLETLKLIKSEFQTSKGRTGKDLGETEQLQILRKMVKQRKDSIEQYLAAGRSELAEQEKAEIKVIEEFIPSAPDIKEIGAYIDSIIESGMKMGPVIGLVKKKFPTADGKTISEEVKKRLSNGVN